ncbi:MAG: bacillithiol biosynthesis cysteine-adding enzyme BshC [Saprospiraceae bacterium]
MQIVDIAFDRVIPFSSRDIQYQLSVEKFGDFIAFEPSIEGLIDAIEERKKHPVDRKVLYDVLQCNYSDTTTSLQAEYIEQVSNERTFTITTAHQPVIFGGPAFYIYKIASVIHLSTTLRLRFPEYNFVPVFVNGGEDHDFDEVKKTFLFQNEIQWDTDQKGAVGRFNTEGLQAILQEFSAILGNSDTAQNISDMLKESLEVARDYNDFVFHWLNKLFGKYGLLVLNMDDPKLKHNFIPIFKKEIEDMPSQDIIKHTQDDLGELGFKPQAYAREVNIFYLSDGARDRIVYQDGNYMIGDSIYTKHEIFEILNKSPENFSPNVILRPLYQEFSLPDIAFIGGGGEIAYWIERKKQFAYFGVYFPTIIRRNSFLIVPKTLQKTIQNLHLNVDDLFMTEHVVVSKYLDIASKHALDFSEEEKQILFSIDAIAAKAYHIDATLEPLVKSEGAKLMKNLSNVQHRILKAAKQKEETALQQIHNLYQKLFPDGGLQERRDNFFSFMANSHKVDLLDYIIKNSNPLDKHFKVVLMD